jgi:D-beta-D-heptose 7-phosphate kinase/D-beta-D-heptose 1-phosphate adenosyltransferase
MDLAPELLGGVVDFAAVNAIVLSDYDKGVVTDSLARMVIRQAHSRGIPVVVDSKRLDPSLFVDCTVITPNRLEAFRMTGSSDPEIAARRIAAITCSAVLVTLGADGMLLVDGDRVDHIGSVAREVADITGAGDSVVAGLAIAIAEGRGLYDAARFGAAVAAVAVGHKGTHAVQRTSVREGSLP